MQKSRIPRHEVTSGQHASADHETAETVLWAQAQVAAAERGNHHAGTAAAEAHAYLDRSREPFRVSCYDELLFVRLLRPLPQNLCAGLSYSCSPPR